MAKRFEVWEDALGWHFQFVASNGEPVGEPAYSSEQAVLTGIEALRECHDAEIVFLPKAEDDSGTDSAYLQDS